MLDMVLGIEKGDFEVLTEDEYKDLMLEHAEKEMLDEGIVEFRMIVSMKMQSSMVG